MALYRDRPFDNAVTDAATLIVAMDQILDDRAAGLEREGAALPAVTKIAALDARVPAGQAVEIADNGPDFAGARGQVDGLLDRSAHDFYAAHRRVDSDNHRRLAHSHFADCQARRL
jgi:hypothetical protein